MREQTPLFNVTVSITEEQAWLAVEAFNQAADNCLAAKDYELYNQLSGLAFKLSVEAEDAERARKGRRPHRRIPRDTSLETPAYQPPTLQLLNIEDREEQWLTDLSDEAAVDRVLLVSGFISMGEAQEDEEMAELQYATDLASYPDRYEAGADDLDGEDWGKILDFRGSEEF